MDNRAKILAKIRALMAKTVDNGCTEAEAMSALTMAQSMMDAYEVTEEDIKLTDEAATVAQSDMRDPHNVRRGLTVAIGQFVDCKVWQTDKVIKFCGLQSDAEFGVWLLDTLSAFVTKELVKHLWQHQWEINKDNKRWHINGFVLGCSSRINKRLNELHEASKRQSTTNHNALVVAKQALIMRKMDELGLNLRTPRKRSSRMEHDSYAAGKAAGDRASFGRPVSGQQGIARIGWKS